MRDSIGIFKNWLDIAVETLSKLEKKPQDFPKMKYRKIENIKKIYKSKS